MLRHEQQAKLKGYDFIVGIDEAGRGPLAGPVVAAAVCLIQDQFENKINDSKKMSPKAREKAFSEIQAKAFVGIGVMSEVIIDRHNILQATFMAMNTAARQLLNRVCRAKNLEFIPSEKVVLLVDGNSFKCDVPAQYQTIVEGDSQSLSIACASIIAKVTRDRILKTYDQIFPQYGFKDHKGYGTVSHRQAIQDHGLSLIHRRSFCHSID